MAMLYTLSPSTLLLIILVFFFFTSVISCNTGSCPPTLPGTTTKPGIPMQPGIPTLNFPPFLPVTPPSLPETPTVNFPPNLPVTPPTLNFPPFLPVTPPSLPETPTTNFPPNLPVTPPTLNFPPFLPVTPPSLPEAPTLPAPILPVTPPSLPETPIPNQQAPPAISGPPIQSGSPTPRQDNSNACPRDVLKLGVCGDMLGRSLGNTIGSPPRMPCCKIMNGLVDFEAAVCLCSALRANVMGTVYDFPIAINNVFNNCQKDLPSGFQCE